MTIGGAELVGVAADADGAHLQSTVFGTEIAPGVLRFPSFVSPARCRQLIETMLPDAAPAPVLVDGVTKVRPEHRRSSTAAVPADAATQFERALRDAMPSLDSHYGTSLSTIDPMYMAVYAEGDFFGPHRDRGPANAHRRISAVIFLNDWALRPRSTDEFCGGVLKLYPSTAASHSFGPAISVTAKAGTLVLFPGEFVHEVSPVTRGRRCTLVSFLGEAPRTDAP